MHGSGFQNLSTYKAKIGHWSVPFVLVLLFINMVLPSVSHAQLSNAEINALRSDFLSMLMQDPIKFGADIPKLISLQRKFNNQIKDRALFYQGMNSAVMNNRDALFNGNPCLADLTVRFYLNVMEKHLSRPIAAVNSMSLKYGSLAGGKPNLISQTMGSGQGIGMDGWAWQEALETAGGNADLAMIALSTWVHDDRYISLKINSAQSLTPMTISRLKNLKDLLSKFYDTYPKDLRDQMVEYNSPVFSPDHSIILSSRALPIELLWPGSLGREIDIKNPLKEEIALLQAPSKGAEALPAKYYHVYGGAAAGCSLRQEGLSEYVSVLVQSKVAEVYRNKRLCADVHAIQKRADRLKKDEAFLLTELDRVLQEPDICQDDEELWKDPACFLVKSYFGNLSPFRASEFKNNASKKARIAKIMDRFYAVDVLTAAAAQAKRKLKDCAADSSIVRQAVLAATAQGEKICGSMDPSACTRGLNTVKTWKIDFDWTVAQQSIGARFGAHHCHPADDKQIKAWCGY